MREHKEPKIGLAPGSGCAKGLPPKAHYHRRFIFRLLQGLYLLINNLQSVFFDSDFCRSDAEVVSVYLYMGGAEDFYTG